MPISSPFTNAFAIEKVIAKMMITNTSIVTVTPITVLVKGPLALISLITAIAEEGDLATKMVANNMDTAIFDAVFKSTINGILSAKKKTIKLVKVKVKRNWLMVIHLILFNLLRRSSKYNSAPAEKAMMDKAISFKKFNLTSACG